MTGVPTESQLSWDNTSAWSGWDEDYQEDVFNTPASSLHDIGPATLQAEFGECWEDDWINDMADQPISSLDAEPEQAQCQHLEPWDLGDMDWLAS